MNVVEWTIHNFSYWNERVHEKHLECSRLGYLNCPRILLYPRGLSGNQDYLYLVVHIYSTSLQQGRLSFIDSRGSVLCCEEISERTPKEGDNYQLRPHLKFADVAAQIRKSEIPDRFTLRCELQWVKDRMYRAYTTIDVHDFYVKIDPTRIKDGEDIRISTIQYPFDETEEKVLSFYIIVGQKKILSIQPKTLTKNSLVSTSLSVLKCDSVLRTEENEHVFEKDIRWTFANSLTKEETSEEGVSLLLRIKIAPSSKYKNCCNHTSYSEAVDITTTNVLKPLKSATTSIKPIDNSTTVLSDDLQCLYQDHDFSDFQLRCGEATFPTHKNILSARSPVFKAMLSADMSEATSDTMEVADLDEHTLGRFLGFLYTGTVNDLEWEGALKLYYAADKYQVPSLKRECCSVFHKNVSVSNVCDVLSLADKHQDEELTKEAQAFVLRNFNDVLRSDGWKTLVKNEPSVIAKTVTYFAEKNIFKVISDS